MDGADGFATDRRRLSCGGFLLAGRFFADSCQISLVGSDYHSSGMLL
jgi:hypothetical protein